MVCLSAIVVSQAVSGSMDFALRLFDVRDRANHRMSFELGTYGTRGQLPAVIGHSASSPLMRATSTYPYSTAPGAGRRLTFANDMPATRGNHHCRNACAATGHGLVVCCL